MEREFAERNVLYADGETLVLLVEEEDVVHSALAEENVPKQDADGLVVPLKERSSPLARSLRDPVELDKLNVADGFLPANVENANLLENPADLLERNSFVNLLTNASGLVLERTADKENVVRSPRIVPERDVKPERLALW